MVNSPQLDEVWLIDLDPVQGSEIRKTRPCAVLSPNEMNRNLRTVIVAPMTTVERTYPSRVNVAFHGKKGQVALDQLRCVDRVRLLKKLGRLPAKTAEAAAQVLVEMFARS